LLVWIFLAPLGSPPLLLQHGLCRVLCFSALCKADFHPKCWEATGLPCEITLDINWENCYPLLEKAGYKDRAGEVFYAWILGGLAERMKRICQEELTKEAIAEVWTTGVVRIEPGGAKMSHYHTCDFVDGDLVVRFRPDSPCTNVSDIGHDIEGKL